MYYDVRYITFTLCIDQIHHLRNVSRCRIITLGDVSVEYITQDASDISLMYQDASDQDASDTLL